MKVTYIEHMGTDLSVVNAARVSFGKKSEMIEDSSGWRLKDADKKLIEFLARGCTTGEWEDIISEATQAGCYGKTQDLIDILNHVRRMPTHWTPFGHTAITLHIKAPIFVARQLGKHQVGMVWNEVSRRYVTDDPEFFFPDYWRASAKNVKQGSSDEPVEKVTFGDYGGTWVEEPGFVYSAYVGNAEMLYRSLIDGGVCPEQARMVLPQSMMTEWYWTGNLYSFANVFIQRTDQHTQAETREVAKQIGNIIAPLYPHSWEALTCG